MGNIRSDIAWSTVDRIVVRGKSFPDEILGKMNLGDFAWFQLTGNVPTPQQSNVFNAIVVALVEHGVTPSVIEPAGNGTTSVMGRLGKSCACKTGAVA